jgi:putative SOS response-associated peptidase YedK
MGGMCGRYTIRRIDLARAAFNAQLAEAFDEFSERARFNIAPSQDIPVVRINKEGGRSIGLVRWGLIPHWAKAEPPKVQPINARAETVQTSGMFKQAFARRRCLIPADGFYEWRREGKSKQPMFVHFPDDRVFGFAGLWERWRPAEDAEPVDTCTIITTTPNKLMSDIHDRMPVILRPEDYGTWLDRDTDPQQAAKLLRPYTDGELEAVPVSKTVNSPKNDTPACVTPLAEE